MPSFTETTEVEIEFEVYCDTCGAGLCSESTTTHGRSRNIKQLRVNACPNCINEKENEIEELKSRIQDLEEELSKYE